VHLVKSIIKCITNLFFRVTWTCFIQCIFIWDPYVSLSEIYLRYVNCKKSHRQLLKSRCKKSIRTRYKMPSTIIGTATCKSSPSTAKYFEQVGRKNS